MSTQRHVESELLTPREAAAELKVSAATIKRWLRDGRLPGVLLPGGGWRIVHDDLRALRVDQIRDHRRRDASAAAREPV